MNAAEKITKARAGLILDQPFFGSLALRLKIREDKSHKTAWTDGQTLGYNPTWVDGLKLDEVKGVIAHEVMHLACAHHARIGNRAPKKWNMAGDYAINQILLDARMTLPAGRLHDPAFKALSADDIYNRIPDPPPSPSPSMGEGRGEGDDDDPGNCGAVRPAPGPDGKNASPADLAQSEADWKVAVAQAAQSAKVMGKLPASLARLVDQVLEPRVNWREVLRRFVDQSARNDYTWTRPNRRYLNAGLYLPALYSQEMGPIVIAVDTSGSIDAETLNQFAAEMTGILQEHKTTCNVLYCDARIAGHQEFAADDLPLALESKGGGGTDFRPPFDWVSEKNLAPACLIYLTDMECSSFPEPPAFPVLWAKFGNGGCPAPFGEEVKIS